MPNVQNPPGHPWEYPDAQSLRRIRSRFTNPVYVLDLAVVLPLHVVVSASREVCFSPPAPSSLLVWSVALRHLRRAL